MIFFKSSHIAITTLFFKTAFCNTENCLGIYLDNKCLQGTFAIYEIRIFTSRKLFT